MKSYHDFQIGDRENPKSISSNRQMPTYQARVSAGELRFLPRAAAAGVKRT